ncbi:hypothetical protein [Aeromonas salmonicida]|nr:hypothetical protein [Aeromonas salmonicida]
MKILNFEESVERCIALTNIIRSCEREMKLIREGKPVPVIEKQEKEVI